MNYETDKISEFESSFSSKYFQQLRQVYQSYLDRWTPYTFIRWLVTVFMVLIFMARILIKQGWYIITYGLGIYHLNLFLAFLSPKIDPALADYEGEIFELMCIILFLQYYTEDGLELPTRSNEEFRPFIRRLPEFKFWYSATKATLIAFICTFFEILNIPAFWPILLVYFIVLFCITMKRQIKHMLRYHYIPFTYGKPKYQMKEGTSKLLNSK